MRFSSKHADDETDLVYYGHRCLNPNLGRWISRDPLQEAGGKPLFGFANNSPITNVDKDGRIIVNRVREDVKKCDLVEYAYRYQLEIKPCDRGWIVQEIDFRVDDDICCTLPLTPPAKTVLFHIWEAFPVASGQDTFTAPGGDYTDGVRYRLFSDLQGLVGATYSIKFFCESADERGITGWRTNPDPARRIYTGGNPWTDQKPSWWDDTPDDASAERSLAIDWMCCPGHEWWNVTSSP